jgi:hypothetical protein
MKKILSLAGIFLLAIGLVSCNNDQSLTTPPGGNTHGNSTAADVFASVFFYNAPGPFTGGTILLDGGNPATLSIDGSGSGQRDIRIYQQVPNGTHTFDYSDSFGTTLSCPVTFGGAADVFSMALCYNLSGGVTTSAATCNFTMKFPCY